MCGKGISLLVILIVSTIVTTHGYTHTYELHGERGQISSPNYPNTYPENQDIIYTIAPTGGSPGYVLTVDHVDLEKGYDYIQVQHVANGPILQTFTGRNVSSTGETFYGKTFFVHFLSDGSNQYSGFRVSYHPVGPSDAVSLSCHESTCEVRVNMTMMDDIYTHEDIMRIELGDKCLGSYRNDTHELLFNYNYTECQGKMMVDNDTVKFNNYLAYQNRDPSGVIVTGDAWTVGLECTFQRETHPQFDFISQTKTDEPHTVSGAGDFAATVRLYNDSSLNWTLGGSSMNMSNVSVGKTYYVQVTYPISDGLKIVLRNCLAVPDASAHLNKTYTLINDGCGVDHSTVIYAYSNTDVIFYFTAFEFLGYYDVIHVTCDVSVCQSSDNSGKCQRKCDAT